jgi:hypothetical protein
VGHPSLGSFHIQRIGSVLLPDFGHPRVGGFSETTLRDPGKSCSSKACCQGIEVIAPAVLVQLMEYAADDVHARWQVGEKGLPNAIEPLLDSLALDVVRID